MLSGDGRLDCGLARHACRGEQLVKPVLVVLLVLNVVVLAGQIWPEGAPPFARTVNVAFLVASLLYFAVQLRAARKR